MSEPLVLALRQIVRRGWPYILAMLVLLFLIGPVINHLKPMEKQFLGRTDLEHYIDTQLPRNSSYSYVVHWLEDHGIRPYDDDLQRGFQPLDDRGVARVIYMGNRDSHLVYGLELHFSDQLYLKDVFFLDN